MWPSESRVYEVSKIAKIEKQVEDINKQLEDNNKWLEDANRKLDILLARESSGTKTYV